MSRISRSNDFLFFGRISVFSFIFWSPCSSLFGLRFLFLVSFCFCFVFGFGTWVDVAGPRQSLFSRLVADAAHQWRPAGARHVAGHLAVRAPQPGRLAQTDGDAARLPARRPLLLVDDAGADVGGLVRRRRRRRWRRWRRRWRFTVRLHLQLTAAHLNVSRVFFSCKCRFRSNVFFHFAESGSSHSTVSSHFC